MSESVAIWVAAIDNSQTVNLDEAPKLNLSGDALTARHGWPQHILVT